MTNRHPHLRLTATDVRDRWLAGIFYKPAGYLLDLIRALRKDGWKLRFTVAEFCKEWLINERAFYRAKAELISRGLIAEKIHGTIELWIQESNLVDLQTDKFVSPSDKTVSASDKTVRGSDRSVSDSDRSVGAIDSKAIQEEDSSTPSDLLQLSTTLSQFPAEPPADRERIFVDDFQEKDPEDRPQPERESDRPEPNFNQTELKQIHSSGEDSKVPLSAPSVKNSFEIAEQDRDFMKWAEARSSGLQARNPKIHAQTCLKRDEDLELWQQYQARKQKPLADDREFTNQSEYAAYVAKRREELLCQ